MSPDDLRLTLFGQLRRDLLGPDANDEVIKDRPTDRYLTGILFPRQQRLQADEDDTLGAGDDDPDSGGEDEAVPLTACIKPASMGLSFALHHDAHRVPVVRVTIEAARYEQVWLGDDPSTYLTRPPAENSIARRRWRRIAPKPHSLTTAVDFTERPAEHLASGGYPGLALYCRSTVVGAIRTMTVVLLNQSPTHKDRDESEEATWFQTRITVEPHKDAVFAPRSVQSTGNTADDRTAALIYRNARSYAVGHSCSARWTVIGSTASQLDTEWIPHAYVPAMSARGDKVFAAAVKGTNLNPFSADWLSTANDNALLNALRLVPAAWDNWCKSREQDIQDLDPTLKAYAEDHRALWHTGLKRIAEAIKLLQENGDARDAFRLANKAMVVQRRWTRNEKDLVWYPFQIAFQLLTLESLLNPKSDNRGVADLLWFPTGGGKTEAYLGCIALLLFYRRLIPQKPNDGAGVNVIMRYTLRVLTTQQFERAAAMICAADLIRSQDSRLADQERLRIGLWIGGDERKKTVAEAHDAKSPIDLKKCPCCGRKVTIAKSKTSFSVECLGKKCELAGYNPVLPVWTVDEDIYTNPPSLLLGTVDKFAQIVRNPATRSLFGIGTTHRAPELIIQDELHLISGPLGTVAGLYETAIDEMCAGDGTRPKVIGSTATIRMADDQVRALFNRKLYQFPPPGIDASNSCFAVQDDSRPGRMYVGVTTAGRSAKFTLQAACASLLQGGNSASVPSNLEDAYWTLVAYFNSLRELGGAHVLMLDDVPKSIETYAARHSEAPRKIREPEELTSRRSQEDIPAILATLGEPKSSGISPDTLLATNMISVGVDIPRLALMVVNGQPKTIAEYIQATSRVGRSEIPGLVVALFNSGKPRDRSYYESFTSWHATLYRSVEPTSVTPFAPRALDRALHAILAGMTRHLVSPMQTNPRLLPALRPHVEAIRRLIVARCRSVDDEERLAVDSRIAAVLDEWAARVTVDTYWNDRSQKSLLVSAERHAQFAAVGQKKSVPWPAPNSMRSVEPATPFRLKA